jgi:hypothetical protein
MQLVLVSGAPGLVRRGGMRPGIVQLELKNAYAVASCCWWAPSLTLTTLDTPGSCMVTP